MFDKIGRGWQLACLSLDVLRANKVLLVFPLLTAGSMSLLFVSFMLPGWAIFGRYMHGASTHTDQLNGALLSFLFYWVNYTVVTFFNVALMAVTLDRLEGGEADITTGLSRALAQWSSILAYSAIAATVGTVLHAIEERVGWLGQIVFGLLGLAWTVSVALVVPVLAAEDAGPFEAVSRSAGLIKDAWGEGLVSAGSISYLTGLILVAVALLGGGAAAGAFMHHFIAFGVLLGVLTISAFAFVLLVQETLEKINLAVLYRFANGGVTPGYDAALLQGAFRGKN